MLQAIFTEGEPTQTGIKSDLSSWPALVRPTPGCTSCVLEGASGQAGPLLPSEQNRALCKISVKNNRFYCLK